MGDGYILSHDATERARLDVQGAMLAPITRELLLRAGLAPAMRVLDVGCGTGAVSALIAEIVGPTGSIVGVDRDDAGFEAARRRVVEAGGCAAEFIAKHLPDGEVGDRFDAVVGRLVLMFFADPRALLRSLVGRVKPGGIAAFHEVTWSTGESMPAAPSVETAYAALRTAFARSGLQIEMGRRIRDDFVALGLEPLLSDHNVVERGGAGILPALLAGLVRSAMPAIQATKAIDVIAIDLPTLEGQMRRELDEQDSTISAPIFVGCYARTAA